MSMDHDLSDQRSVVGRILALAREGAMMKDFVKNLDKELTVLDQEVALLEKEIQHVRRRQDKVRRLRGLYTGVNILPDELEPAEAQIALSEADMIARVKENAGRELSMEEVREHVHRDFGMNLTSSQVCFARAPRWGESQL
jgi:hypothetical protein